MTRSEDASLSFPVLGDSLDHVWLGPAGYNADDEDVFANCPKPLQVFRVRDNDERIALERQASSRVKVVFVKKS
jgi:hypothetical protein